MSISPVKTIFIVCAIFFKNSIAQTDSADCDISKLTDFGTRIELFERELQNGSGEADSETLKLHALETRSVWFNIDFSPSFPKCAQKYPFITKLGLKVDEREKDKSIAFVSRTNFLKNYLPNSFLTSILSDTELAIIHTLVNSPIIFERNGVTTNIGSTKSSEISFEIRWTDLSTGIVNIERNGLQLPLKNEGYIKYNKSNIPILITYGGSSDQNIQLIRNPDSSSFFVGARSRHQPHRRLDYTFSVDVGFGFQNISGKAENIYDPAINTNVNTNFNPIFFDISFGPAGIPYKGIFWSIEGLYRTVLGAGSCSGGSSKCSTYVVQDIGVRASLVFNL